MSKEISWKIEEHRYKRMSKARIKSDGYVEREESRNAWRDWWLVKNDTLVTVGKVRMPKRMVGKKVRVRFELVKENP